MGVFIARICFPDVLDNTLEEQGDFNQGKTHLNQPLHQESMSVQYIHPYIPLYIAKLGYAGLYMSILKHIL